MRYCLNTVVGGRAYPAPTLLQFVHRVDQPVHIGKMLQHRAIAAQGRRHRAGLSYSAWPGCGPGAWRPTRPFPRTFRRSARAGRPSAGSASARAGVPRPAAPRAPVRTARGRPGPRPIMTPSQPVSFNKVSAPSALVTSPFASTGMDTACLMAAMAAVSMGGMYICSRVRPCTAIKSAPPASSCLATSTPVRLSASQPMRIFTVSGVCRRPAPCGRRLPSARRAAGQAGAYCPRRCW